MIPQTGHILVAHGSANPRWRAPFEAIADALSQRSPDQIVHLCYLEKWQPTVPEAVNDLHQKGCRQIHISPLFLSSGRHLEEDLPRILATCLPYYPDLTLSTGPALGEQDTFLTAILNILSKPPTPIPRTA